MFPKIVVPQNGWFMMENPIKMDDLGAHPYFWQHPHVSTISKHIRTMGVVFLLLPYRPDHDHPKNCLRMFNFKNLRHQDGHETSEATISKPRGPKCNLRIHPSWKRTPFRVWHHLGDHLTYYQILTQIWSPSREAWFAICGLFAICHVVLARKQ